MPDFEGKVAVISGGASGVGRAFADRLAQDGVRHGRRSRHLRWAVC
jgi:NAD(P)-dependent dehydrogenase (short-subunit alcohol dehydrogenase family)